MKRVFPVMLALVFALAFVVPAVAAPPVITYLTFDGTWVYPAGTLCPFVVEDHLDLHNQQRTYFDNAGNVVRIERHYQGFDNFSSPDNPDVVLTGHISTTGGVDPATGTDLDTSGLTTHITVPGYGTVLVAAGRWSQFPTDHIAGKDSFSDPEDLAQFCAALAAD